MQKDILSEVPSPRKGTLGAATGFGASEGGSVLEQQGATGGQTLLLSLILLMCI